MLAKRGLSTGLPRNLKEILAGDRKGWTSKTCWALEISHGLMGFFPAIVKASKIMVLVSDMPLIFRVWRSLEPKESKLIARECIVNDVGTVAYFMMVSSDYDKEHSLPQKLFSVAEINELFAKNASAFGWAPGLFGADIDPDQFRRIVDAAEKSRAT
jgi:hypothetical protein